FLDVAGELLGPDDLAPAQRVDLELPLGLVNPQLEKLMRYLEPCGPGNPAPVFGVRGARAVGARRVGTNHLRFTLDDGSGALPAIGFHWADLVPDAWLAQPPDVAFRLERDEWQGRAPLPAPAAARAPAASSPCRAARRPPNSSSGTVSRSPPSKRTSRRWRWMTAPWCTAITRCASPSGCTPGSTTWRSPTRRTPGTRRPVSSPCSA